MTLSRRDFLRLCGVTLAGAALPPVRAQLPARRLQFAGRALETAHIFAAPRLDAAMLRRVHPDSMLPLTLDVEGWYRVFGADGGYVPARAVQPMLPYTRPQIITRVDAPFVAEVIAPVTVARRWPLADAPTVGRPGYGATLHVIDAQTDDWGHVWYRSDEAAGGGWVQALHARRLDAAETAPINPGAPDKRLMIDTVRCRLVALEGERTVMEGPVSVPTSWVMAHGDSTPKPGHTSVAGKCPVRAAAGYWGAPWMIEAEGVALHGAYWHNDFGAPRADAGGAITLAPEAARWVYRWVDVGATPIEIA